MVDRGRDQVHHAPVVAVRVALGRLLAAVLAVGRVVLLAQRLDAQPPKFLLALKETNALVQQDFTRKSRCSGTKVALGCVNSGSRNLS